MQKAGFQWFRTGDEAFGDMLDAIDAAECSVRLETYIFADCGLGRRFLQALTRARLRGLEVKVLLDAFGSLDLAAGFWKPLLDAGGAVRRFNPLGFKRPSFRDHRKLLVCDEQVAYVGGFNVAPEYEGDGVARGWRDAGLRLCGPLAGELTEAFEAMFSRADLQHRPFTRFRKTPARRRIATGEGEILLSGPGRGRNAIKRSLVRDLAQARRVQIAAAYFLPIGRLRRALTRVARRGGQVQLVLPGRSDVPLARLASHSYYLRLLRAGVEIHEYQPQVLHTKLIVVDDACYVGSSNLDARSLYINYEIMVRMTDPALVQGARGIFLDHLRHAVRIERPAWRASRGFWTRLKERWACFLLVKLDTLLMRRQLRYLRP